MKCKKESTAQKAYLRRQLHRRRLVLFCRIFLFVFFLICWEMSARLGLIDAFIFSSPSRTVRCFLRMMQDKSILIHTGVTLYETLISFTLVILFGLIGAVVFALAAAVRAYTKEGDGVLLQQPVYYPFSEVITDNGRKIVNSPLKITDGYYTMDLDALETKIVKNKVKLFLLCSPHNPVGRVWSEEELRRVGEICLRHGVLVVSDEIHSDFTREGHPHTVFAKLGAEFEQNCLICTAPSKTFNLAGLQISNIFVPNPELRKKLLKEIAAAGYSQVGLMGLVACQAAYEEGAEWLAQLKVYLEENRKFVKAYLEEHLPEIRLIEPEGTYLLWLDFKALHLNEKELEHLIVDKAHLWLDSGAMFGPDGEGFERINIACPRATVEKALKQLEAAIRG